MARHTDITCDGPGCGFMDGTDGETAWRVLTRDKAKRDFCSDDCLAKYVARLPKQLPLEEATA